MKKDARIERELKNSKKLTEKRIQSEIKDAEANIEDYLNEGDVLLALFQAISLARPVLWRGHRAIAHSDNSGWTDVLDYCRAVIAIHKIAGSRISHVTGELAPPLLLLLAVDGWSPALGSVHQQLRDDLAKTRGGDRDDLHLSFFASFMAQAMATTKARPGGPDGALRKLTSELPKEIRPKTLTNACEFQLENTGSTDEDGVEFVNFELIPVWWFAMARARKDRGLETPVPDHALFSTPFARLPERIHFDPKKSALLKRVGEIAKLLK